MPSFKSVLTASAMAFFASTNAHMILKTPAPYGSPNSSPLDPSGSNFPCKATTSSGGPVTEMAIGSQQALSFQGSAVHGGGSCQIALTKDNPATKASKWMVIHSIHGGCPARGASGNLGSNPEANNADKYPYTIPQGIAPGTYTLAWTWFNKIGNREMYMNCASVKVTGGSGKRDIPLNETEEYAIPELSERDTPNFPPLFIANAPPTDCTTTESANLQFPDPGKSVETNAGSGKLAPPTGPKCGAGGSGGASSGSGAGSSSGAGAGPDAGASSGSGAGSSSGAGAGAGSGSGASPAAGGSSGSSSGSGASPAAPSAPSAPTGGASSDGSSSSPAKLAAAPPAAAPSSPPPPPSTSGSSSGSTGSGASAPAAGGAKAGTCTQPGQSICSPDGKQIGTCTMGNTVTWIPVAAGTKCSGGVMVMAKRSAKFNSRYIRRNFAGNFGVN